MTEQFVEASLIDDFAHPGRAHNGARWQYFSDRVMGGISQGSAQITELNGRQALRLRGDVSLENNGGFIQAALDLAPDTADCDASAYAGIAITVLGDGDRYAVNLRSADVRRPWQSYRCEFIAGPDWVQYHLPFDDFLPNRIDRPLDTSRLRRLGIIAIGEAGPADVAVARLAFFSRRSNAQPPTRNV